MSFTDTPMTFFDASMTFPYAVSDNIILMFLLIGGELIMSTV